ncbi:hypothetical protein [Nonomuraea sp. SYSU D8015]|uniref:hypothetical protein n=1 Tax=Nonomuraea sp. SYSU D8015 TaxID=2593644 RepID=UPI0016612861|nr:hypothetical protein [Nonomuraea sp. SYSU D8015]
MHPPQRRLPVRRARCAASRPEISYGGSARKIAACTAASRLVPAQTSSTPGRPYARATGGNANAPMARPSV